MSKHNGLLFDCTTSGGRLEKHIIENFGNYKAFAKHAGMPQSTISTLIANKAKPKRSTLAKLEKAGVDMAFYMSNKRVKSEPRLIKDIINDQPNLVLIKAIQDLTNRVDSLEKDNKRLKIDMFEADREIIKSKKLILHIANAVLLTTRKLTGIFYFKKGGVFALIENKLSNALTIDGGYSYNDLYITKEVNP